MHSQHCSAHRTLRACGRDTSAHRTLRACGRDTSAQSAPCYPGCLLCAECSMLPGGACSAQRWCRLCGRGACYAQRWCRLCRRGTRVVYRPYTSRGRPAPLRRVSSCCPGCISACPLVVSTGTADTLGGAVRRTHPWGSSTSRTVGEAPLRIVSSRYCPEVRSRRADMLDTSCKKSRKMG